MALINKLEQSKIMSEIESRYDNDEILLLIHLLKNKIDSTSPVQDLNSNMKKGFSLFHKR